jgi:hypothetical protein
MAAITQVEHRPGRQRTGTRLQPESSLPADRRHPIPAHNVPHQAFQLVALAATLLFL